LVGSPRVTCTRISTRPASAAARSTASDLDPIDRGCRRTNRGLAGLVRPEVPDEVPRTGSLARRAAAVPPERGSSEIALARRGSAASSIECVFETATRGMSSG
jgi:hypothetical protein